MSARIVEPPAAAIPVIVDVDRQLFRELLERAIDQQTDLMIVPFETRYEDQRKQPDLSVEETLKHELNNRHCDVIVVITSVERYGEAHYRDVCSRWLDEFPELLVIVVSWQDGWVITLRNEIRTETIPSNLDQILNAIREIAS